MGLGLALWKGGADGIGLMRLLHLKTIIERWLVRGRARSILQYIASALPVGISSCLSLIEIFCVAVLVMQTGVLSYILRI